MPPDFMPRRGSDLSVGILSSPAGDALPVLLPQPGVARRPDSAAGIRGDPSTLGPSPSWTLLRFRCKAFRSTDCGEEQGVVEALVEAKSSKSASTRCRRILGDKLPLCSTFFTSFQPFGNDGDVGDVGMPAFDGRRSPDADVGRDCGRHDGDACPLRDVGRAQCGPCARFARAVFNSGSLFRLLL